MIYKLTSIKEVISKIVRDLGLGESEIRYQDFIEWIGEGLKHIGAYPQFTEKEALVVIENYKGVLPCDFYQMIQLQEGAECTPAEGNNHQVVSQVLKELGFTDANSGLTLSPRAFQLLQLSHLERTSTNPFTGFYDRMFSNENLIGRINVGAINGIRSLDYNITHDVINTTFRDGFLTLKYLAFPVDCDGYPLVPDDVSFFDAMFWKVAYHLAIRGHQFRNPQMSDMHMCRQKWNFYCLQARGTANAPDLETLEQIKNMWIRLIPNYHEYQEDFYTSGRPELRLLDGRH